MGTSKSLITVAVIAILVVAVPVSCSAGMLGNFFGEGKQVLQEELGPRAILKKYEWFKDMSAQLDKYKADITAFQAQIDDLNADYEGVKRKDWDRVDKQTMSQYRQQLTGILSMYNRLAAEYNAQSNKVNWQYFDTTDGDVPPKSYAEIK